MKDIAKTISSNVKAERIRADLTQEEVANALEITREAYNKLENGKRFNAIYLYKLANIFNCNINAFYMGLDFTICGNEK